MNENKTISKKVTKDHSLAKKLKLFSKKKRHSNTEEINIYSFMKTELNKNGNVLENIAQLDFSKMRKTNQMYYMLIKIPGFKEFMHRHRIFDKITLQKACELMKLFSLSQGEVLFNQGQRSDFFYGVLSGSVGIYKIKEHYKGKEDDNKEIYISKKEFTSLPESHQKCFIKVIEKELVDVKKQGDFFGEMEMFYHKYRKHKAIVLEDCELMYLHYIEFNQCFGRQLIKNHTEYKKYLIEKNSFFNKYNHKSNETFYSFTNIKQYYFDEYLYKQNHIGKSLFFILQGSVVLEKDVDLNNPNNKKELSIIEIKNNNKVCDWIKYITSISFIQNRENTYLKSSSNKNLLSKDDNENKNGLNSYINSSNDVVDLLSNTERDNIKKKNNFETVSSGNDQYNYNYFSNSNNNFNNTNTNNANTANKGVLGKMSFKKLEKGNESDINGNGFDDNVKKKLSDGSFLNYYNKMYNDNKLVSSYIIKDSNENSNSNSNNNLNKDINNTNNKSSYDTLKNNSSVCISKSSITPITTNIMLDNNKNINKHISYNINNNNNSNIHNNTNNANTLNTINTITSNPTTRRKSISNVNSTNNIYNEERNIETINSKNCKTNNAHNTYNTHNTQNSSSKHINKSTPHSKKQIYNPKEQIQSIKEIPLKSNHNNTFITNTNNISTTNRKNTNTTNNNLFLELTKESLLEKEILHNEEIYLNKKELIILEKGEIFGLDCLYGKNTYDYSAKSKTNKTIILEIQINKLDPFTVANLVKAFFNLHVLREKFINKKIVKMSGINKDLKIQYLSDLKEAKINKKSKANINKINSIIEDSYFRLIENKKRPKTSCEFNDFKGYLANNWYISDCDNEKIEEIDEYNNKSNEYNDADDKNYSFRCDLIRDNDEANDKFINNANNINNWNNNYYSTASCCSNKKDDIIRNSTLMNNVGSMNDNNNFFNNKNINHDNIRTSCFSYNKSSFYNSNAMTDINDDDINYHFNKNIKDKKINNNKSSSKDKDRKDSKNNPSITRFYHKSQEINLSSYKNCLNKITEQQELKCIKETGEMLLDEQQDNTITMNNNEGLNTKTNNMLKSSFSSSCLKLDPKNIIKSNIENNRKYKNNDMKLMLSPNNQFMSYPLTQKNSHFHTNNLININKINNANNINSFNYNSNIKINKKFFSKQISYIINKSSVDNITKNFSNQKFQHLAEKIKNKQKHQDIVNLNNFSKHKDSILELSSKQSEVRRHTSHNYNGIKNINVNSSNINIKMSPLRIVDHNSQPNINIRTLKEVQSRYSFNYNKNSINSLNFKQYPDNYKNYNTRISNISSEINDGFNNSCLNKYNSFIDNHTNKNKRKTKIDENRKKKIVVLKNTVRSSILEWNKYLDSVNILHNKDIINKENRPTKENKEFNQNKEKDIKLSFSSEEHNVKKSENKNKRESNISNLDFSIKESEISSGFISNFNNDNSINYNENDNDKVVNKSVLSCIENRNNSKKLQTDISKVLITTSSIKRKLNNKFQDQGIKDYSNKHAKQEKINTNNLNIIKNEKTKVKKKSSVFNINSSDNNYNKNILSTLKHAMTNSELNTIKNAINSSNLNKEDLLHINSNHLLKEDKNKIINISHLSRLNNIDLRHNSIHSSLNNKSIQKRIKHIKAISSIKDINDFNIKNLLKQSNLNSISRIKENNIKKNNINSSTGYKSLKKHNLIYKSKYFVTGKFDLPLTSQIKVITNKN